MNNKGNKSKETKKSKITKFFNKILKGDKPKYTTWETIIFAIIIFGVGLIVGGIIIYSKSINKSSLNEFIATYDEIIDNYYQKIDKDKLLEAGIDGMIKYLGDPYSSYINKNDVDDFNEGVNGTYQGIGAEVKYNENNLPTIGEVFKNTPAEKVGLKENDIILKVNDIIIKDKSLAEIAEIVKGKSGTNVKLTILRGKEEKTFTITRGTVDNISVISEIINSNNKKIGYIYISVFASNTAKQFKEKLEYLEKEKINSLIIDVRGNTGGYLNVVTDIISMFIKKDEVIYKLKTKNKIDSITDKTIEYRTYPVAILADRGSASASELLIGAFSETYNAKIIGENTYGKGKVQKVFELSSGALLKYTYQEWLTPKGNYIDGVGIMPDINVKYEYISDNRDTQKDKAIEILSK